MCRMRAHTHKHTHTHTHTHPLRSLGCLYVQNELIHPRVPQSECWSATTHHATRHTTPHHTCHTTPHHTASHVPHHTHTVSHVTPHTLYHTCHTTERMLERNSVQIKEMSDLDDLFSMYVSVLCVSVCVCVCVCVLCESLLCVCVARVCACALCKCLFMRMCSVYKSVRLCLCCV